MEKVKKLILDNQFLINNSRYVCEIPNETFLGKPEITFEHVQQLTRISTKAMKLLEFRKIIDTYLETLHIIPFRHRRTHHIRHKPKTTQLKQNNENNF